MKLISFFSACLASTFAMDIFASEQSVYDFLWLDPDKKVYVLQNKIHKKEKTFFFNAGIGKTVNNDYQTAKNYVFKAGYFFHEEWGVELLYMNYDNKDNAAFTNLQQVNTAYPFIRKMKQSYGALATWAPFYGKINTFNKIVYFDWMFGAGVTRLEAENNRDTFISRSPNNVYKSEAHNALALKTQLKFHLTKHSHINLELINQHYRAPSPINPNVKELNTNTDVIVSVGFSF
jgi:outer membrane beta-barrel protein